MSGSPFGILEAYSANKAADQQVDAAGRATQATTEMYNQSRADLAPWREAGAGAINALWGGVSTPEGAISKEQFSNNWSTAIGHPLNYKEQAYVDLQYQQYVKDNFPGQNALTTGLIQQGPGEFKESPSYQFALEQGQQGIQRAASATGRLGSGAYLKDATKYAEGMASQEYGNFLQRYYDSLKPYQSLAGLGQSSAGQQANINTLTGQQTGQNYLAAGEARAAGTLGSYGAIGKAMGEGARAVGSWGLSSIFGGGGGGGGTNGFAMPNYGW